MSSKTDPRVCEAALFKITAVRTSVAKFESTPLSPILADIDVKAKVAERSTRKNQLLEEAIKRRQLNAGELRSPERT